MTATISSNPGKAAVVSPDSGLSKVSSSKAKEVAPGNAPEIINKTPTTKISSTPAAVVSLGNSKSAGLDLYQKNGSLEKSDKKTTDSKAPETKTPEVKVSVKDKEADVKKTAVKEAVVKDSNEKKEQTVKKTEPEKNNPAVNTKEKTSSELKSEKEKPTKEVKTEVKKDTKVEAKTSKKSADPAPDESGDFVAGKGDVVVDVKASESGYDNRIFYSTDNFKTKNYIGTDNQTGSVNLGKFKEGTKIQFGIDNGVGQFFKSGAASGNLDNIAHAKVTKTADGTEFGFEDLVGGGDNDFNDAIINVRNIATADKKPEVNAPEVTTKTVKEKTNTNRSGLGDGTNPGRGAGTSNATNQGTNNPGAINSVTKLSKASAYTTKAVVESQLKVAV